MTNAMFTVILDLKKKKRNMKCFTELLNEKLQTTVEENNALAEEVAGMWISNVLSQVHLYIFALSWGEISNKWEWKLG